MKTIVLGGFLGSGKTTFLLKLAQYLVEQSQSQKDCRLMIIENEIGSVGVDNALLAASGFGVRNLFSGCACCTLAGDLVQTVQKIRQEYDLDYLIVEASGVAMPGNICNTLQCELGLQTRMIVLADASRWRKLLTALKMVIPGQLEKADVVLLNKADLVDDETMRTVENSVRGFVPNALLVPICAAMPISGSKLGWIMGNEI